jgi:hypothetical protein
MPKMKPVAPSAKGPLLAELLEQPAGQDVGAAGDLDDPAQHGAEGHDQRDAAQRVAHAGGQGRDDLGERDAAGQRQGGRGDHQGEEGVHLPLDDQAQDDRDGGESQEDECGGGHGILVDLRGLGPVVVRYQISCVTQDTSSRRSRRPAVWTGTVTQRDQDGHPR